MTDRNDTNPNLPPELASLDAALGDLAASERHSAGESLASRTLLKTNSIIATAPPASSAPSGVIESKWRPLMRVAAAVLLFGAVGTIAIVGLKGQNTPGVPAESGSLNSIAMDLDDWLMSDEFYADNEFSQELASLADDLESIDLTDTSDLDFTEEDFAL